SRWTLARIRAEARTPYSMRWGEDLEALLVRYGAEVAFEQQRAPALNLGPTPVLGRLHPDGRAAFPGADGIRDPAGIEPGRWGWDARRGRERHRPAYASRLAPLPLQEARFERGEAALLVLAWGGPSAPAPGGIEEGIFLVTLPERSVP